MKGTCAQTGWHNYWIVDCVTDTLSGWLNYWLTVLMTYRVTDWPCDRTREWLSDLLTAQLYDWLIGLTDWILN